MTLRVAILQHEGAVGDVRANLDTISDAARSAAENGAGLLVTPEMFLTGYNLEPDRLVELAAEPLEEAVRAVARASGVAIVIGLPYPTAGGVTNSLVFVDADGTVKTRYHKTHLFGPLDRALFQPGDDPAPVVELGGVRVSVLICYDVEFPETVRAAALAGAELVVVPTAQMEPYAFIADHLIRVRAWENQVYLLYANRVGREDDLRYVGRSSIVSPSGDVLAQGGADQAQLLFADIDPQAVRTAQARNPYLDDRRTDLYPSALLSERPAHD